MYIDIKTVVCLHLQCSLYTCGREESLRRVAAYRLAHLTSDFRQTALGIVIFLRVVVAGYPPCGVVAVHGELSVFLLYDEIIENPLLRKFVTESDTIVIYPETYIHFAVMLRLVETHQKFIVIVTDVTVFTPYRLPHLAYGAEITSPSGTVKLKADVVDSVPVYSIEYKNKKVVLPSKLGFELADGPDMMDGFRLIDTSVSSFDEVWQPVWGENSHIRNNYNELLMRLEFAIFHFQSTYLVSLIILHP